MSKPIIQTRDKNLSISIFENDKEGKKSYSFNLQRSYKDKEDKYVNEVIHLFSDDVPALSNLLLNTYNKYLDMRVNGNDSAPF